MIKEFLKKYRLYFALIFIFLTVFFVFGHYKTYLYEDEVLSYTAANCQDGMRPAIPVNRIVDGEEFVRNAVTVRPDRRFDFKNAIANTSKDPHPPVYLLMLHSVCSLFPGVFSKWFALFINLIFGAVTLILLYLTGDRVFTDEKKGFVTAVIYALSLGFITQLMNLRMYVVLQAFTTALTLQYVCILGEGEAEEHKSFSVKRIALFIINVVLGTMTHYYFLIFAFFEAAVFSIMLIRKKRYSDLFRHTLIYVLSGVITLLIFPPILWQLTGSDVGSESFSSRNAAELIRRIRVMLSNLNSEMFGGQMKFFILCFVIWLIYAVVRKLKRNEPGREATELREFFAAFNSGFLLVFLTSVFYFLTVSVTTPYLTGRYLSPIYPLIILITVGLFKGLILNVFKSQPFGYFVLVLIMAVPLYLQISAGLFDVNKAAMQEISKENGDRICVFFRGISTEENYFELQNYKRLMAMRLNPEEGEEPGDLGAFAKEKELVIYVPDEKDPEEYFERVREYNPDLKNSEKLYNAYYSIAYRLF